MKKLLIGLLLSLTLTGISAQEAQQDEVAVLLLERMARIIGDLDACSFTLFTSIDVNEYDLGMIKKNNTDDIYLAGPDKMHIQFHGDNGHRGIWYNGELFYYYSYDENNFAVVEAPPTIISTIDSIHENYGIEFPAADFLYPTFSEDMQNDFPVIRYLGMKEVNGQDCFHILGVNDKMRVQIWLSNDSFTLPVKFVIVYTTENNRQYESSFSNWKLNPIFPDAMFNFLPPPKAAQVYLMPKTNNE